MKKIDIFFMVLFLVAFTFALYGTAIFVSCENDTTTALATTETASTTTETTTEVITETTTVEKYISIPYIGMGESMIYSTGLGSPSSKIRHNTEMINGYVYTANLYDFYDGNHCVFIARCVRGKVTEVWDYRSGTTTRRAYKDDYTTKDSDPYNAKDYKNIDDFYEDHYYDFYDYYDAENYYKDHTD